MYNRIVYFLGGDSVDCRALDKKITTSAALLSSFEPSVKIGMHVG